MRPTRARLAAGAVAFGCLLGPAGAALADKPDDEQPPPPPEQREDRDEGRDRDREPATREAEPRDPRCDREVERGEELITLDDLCAGEAGDDERPEPGRRTASATGTVRSVALLGALALLSAVGLRILALRSRDPR